MRKLLQQLPNLLRNMDVAARRRDFAGLSDLAHQLAGTAGYLAAADLAAAARELKEAATGPDRAAALRALAGLRGAAVALRRSAAKRGIRPEQ